MAKKKQTKKHKFKYAAAPGVAGADAGVTVAGPASSAPVAAAAGSRTVRAAGFGRLVETGGRDFSYVGRDLRKIAVLAVSLVLLEILLWYLFAHTGLGNAVYTSVQV